MKKVLFASTQQNLLIVLGLFMVVVVPLNLRMSQSPESASVFALFLAFLAAESVALDFIRRAMTWEASRLVPGYSRKIWKNSLGIVGFYVALGTLLSFGMGHLTPPVGVAAMLAIGSLALDSYSRRTGNRAVSTYSLLFSLSILVIILLYLWGSFETLSIVLQSATSPMIQMPAIAIATLAGLVLKKEIERFESPRTTVAVDSWDRFHLQVAGRIRIFGWPHPAAHFTPISIYLIPIFVIVAVSHTSFAIEGSDLLESSASRWSLVVAIFVYIGTGTPFGLLKNPGLWLSKAWLFGLGESRNSLGREFALRIVQACIVPGLFVFGVTVVHAYYVEAPLPDWIGYSNFYDEALLLFTVNLLCFIWACASYPKRTAECPVFIPIRIALCVVSCLVFGFGVEFGLELRVLLVITLFGSAMSAIYVGGRLVAGIDFLPIKKEIDQIGV